AGEKDLEPNLDNSTADNADENDFYKYITPPSDSSSKGYKKLTRLPNRKISGGVCAGFAHYLSIDPLWTRLITILLIFSGGFIIVNNIIHFFPSNLILPFSFLWWTAFALL